MTDCVSNFQTFQRKFELESHFQSSLEEHEGVLEVALLEEDVGLDGQRPRVSRVRLDHLLDVAQSTLQSALLQPDLNNKTKLFD